jgi:hypothetical protein
LSSCSPDISPDEQIALIKAISATWNVTGHMSKALALSINEVKGAALGPDHAEVFETTLLGALWPERVDVSRLPARAQQDSGDDPLVGKETRPSASVAGHHRAGSTKLQCRRRSRAAFGLRQLDRPRSRRRAPALTNRFPKRRFNNHRRASARPG